MNVRDLETQYPDLAAIFNGIADLRIVFSVGLAMLAERDVPLERAKAYVEGGRALVEVMRSCARDIERSIEALEKRFSVS